MKKNIKSILKPFYLEYKKWKERKTFLKAYNLSDNKNVKIVVGSSGVYEKGWIPTEYHFLNLLKEKHWFKYFNENSISNIVAEHVWEHLDIEDGLIAAKTCYKFLKVGGKLRVAVPDGYHPDKKYIDYVRPNGLGPGADDHKVLYNYKTLNMLLSEAGFNNIEMLEHFDENNEFHIRKWDAKDGLICRSLKFDERNRNGKPNYTSLIIDVIK